MQYVALDHCDYHLPFRRCCATGAEAIVAVILLAHERLASRIQHTAIRSCRSCDLAMSFQERHGQGQQWVFGPVLCTSL